MDVTLDAIWDARAALRGFIRETDLVPLELAGRGLAKDTLYLKAENLQHTGSFKVRGAYNRMRQMTPEERAAGVIASSAGNHAQGVALAARALGVKATIVMPATAPLQKIDNTRALGAEVVLHGAVFDDAFQKAVELQRESGALFVHPFNDPWVIAGQGTAALEILEQLPDAEAILVPMGGGGLAAGIAVAAKALKPHIKIIGVEPVGAASMKQSLADGHVVSLTAMNTIADGVAIKTPGDVPFALCSRLLDGVLTVEEDEIAGAILYLMERAKMVAEGAGAVTVAAAMRQENCLQGLKTVAVVSGGNIDVSMVSRIIDRGLVSTGRKAEFEVRIPDRPGQLARVLECIAQAGANILSIQHERSSMNLPLGHVLVELTLETSGCDHIADVLKRLEAAGINAIEVTC